MLKIDRSAFMRAVEAHERGWGSETYKGRPTLDQIMHARVVALWLPPEGVDDELPPTITLHKQASDIENYLLSLILHASTRIPRLRLAKIFVNKREIKIKSVKILFDV